MIYTTCSTYYKMVDRSAEELAEAAEGNILKKNLTMDSGILFTYLYDGPLIDYVNNGEQPEYVFSHETKGYRITEQNGNERTPHHNGSEGKRYLLITDQRVLYVAGCMDGDETIEHSYAEIDDIESLDAVNDNIQFYSSNGKTYKFAQNGDMDQTIDAAVDYVSERIRETEQGAGKQTESEEQDSGSATIDRFDEGKAPTKEQNAAQTTVGDTGRAESIETVRGVDQMVVESLRNAGYDSLEDLIMLSSTEVLELSGVDEDRANRIKSDINDLARGSDKNSISKSRDVLSEERFNHAINRAEKAVASDDTEQAEEIYKNLLTHLEDAIEEFDTLSSDNKEKIAERLEYVRENLNHVDNINKINHLRTAATESIETANDSQTNGEFELAEKQYEEAISNLEQASELCDSSTDEYQDITKKIEFTKESLTDLRERKEFLQSENDAAMIIETADTAKNNCEFKHAEEQYREALEYLEQAKEICDSSTDDHQNVVEEIEYVRKNIELTSDLTGKRPKLTETLIKAERSFQEGVAGYVDDDQTVAKIRFRQARDEFENARQIIDNSDDFLLNQPVDVTAEPQLSPPVNTIAKFTRITDATVEMLSSMSIEAIEDLQVDDGGLQSSVIETFESRGAVTEEESTLLTILSWWDEGGSTEFGTANKIDCRFERSKYGFEKSK